jgi:hypothetical protein
VVRASADEQFCIAIRVEDVSLRDNIAIVLPRSALSQPTFSRGVCSRLIAKLVNSAPKKSTLLRAT